ncbi:MAG TPA: hypothetical protein VKF61_01915, partial [Candidatus Polarisedimenticolia bacterium]|nr:hypothetical protein [Candidatus Polarisedimenticolia bacterium]
EAAPPEREPGRAEPKAGGRPRPGVTREAPPPEVTADMLRGFAEDLSVLAPGEVRRFEFSAGPVLSAGRYKVDASIDDLASSILGEAKQIDGAPGKREKAPPQTAARAAIEAETVVRFEQ